MQPKTVNIIKRIVDAVMTVLLLFLTAFQVTGDVLHEWLGIGMTLTLILHHILNRKWYKAVFTGKYSTYRIAMTAVYRPACLFRSDGSERDVHEQSRSPFPVWAYRCYDSTDTAPCHVLLVIYPYGSTYRSSYESHDSKDAEYDQARNQGHTDGYFGSGTAAVHKKRYREIYHFQDTFCFS